jgi:nitrogen fixation NifU-like protein
MNELRELYQELILDHGKHPRNFGELSEFSHHAAGHNPLCGDRLVVKLLVEGDLIKDVRFVGSGCAISTAAASTMTEAVKGKRLDEVRQMFTAFHDAVTGKAKEGATLPAKLRVFEGVAAYPMRVKCATLAWHTLTGALEGKRETTTE